MDANDATRVPLTISRGCIVASVQRDLRGAVLQQFRDDLLERLQTSGANGVIIDLSGLSVIDTDDFDGIRRTLDMATLMGARTVVVGLRPGVVSALVELDADTGNFDTLLDLDDGFALFERLNTVEEEVDDEQTTEEENPDVDKLNLNSDSNIDLIDGV